MTSSLRLWLAALLLLLLASPALAEPLMVAADHSLTAAQYAEKGLPLPNHPWDDDDLRHAVAILQKLAAEDPLKLPRLESAASGAVFARLVAPLPLAKDATTTSDLRARIADLSGYAQPRGALALLYAKPLAGDFFFDAELVEATRVALDVNLRLLQLINQARSLHGNTAAPEWLQREDAQVVYGAALTIRGALFIYAARRAFRPAWRDQLAGDLQKLVPTMMAQLPEATHAELLAHLHGLMLEDPKGFADWQQLQQLMTFVGHGPPAFARPRKPTRAQHKK